MPNRETSDEIDIPGFVLCWSPWVPWTDLALDSRTGCGPKVPNGRPGVYEVRHKNSALRLTIGKASDLRMRLKQGLIKGKTPHSAGTAIRSNENVSDLVVRWAVTDRPAAAEEELHLRYKAKHGVLPKYVQHT